MMKPKRKFVPKPSPIVKDFNEVRAKKTHKKRLPKAVLTTWRSVYKNFTVRHAKLKQGPLKSQYEIINDYFEGLA